MKRRVFWMLSVVLLVIAGCSERGKIERDLERGNAHFEAGRWEAATIEYLNVLRMDRSNEVAIVRSGLAHYELGNIREAAVLLREGVELRPDDLGLRQKLGTLFMRARGFPQAREQAEEILARDPDNFDGLMLLADASVQREQVAEVEARLVGAEAQFGDRYAYHLALAGLRMRRGAREEARASLARAEAMAPEEVAVLEALADFHLGANEVEAAAGYLERAAALAAPVSETRAKWAALRYLRGDRDAGLEALRAMVAEDPRFVPAWERLGEFALRDGRLDDGEEAVNAILAVDPEHFAGRMLQARLWQDQGKAAEAAGAFEALSRRQEQSGLLRQYLGIAYMQSGRIEEAKTALREAFTLDPRLTKAVLQLSELNLRTGQAATAVSDMEALIGERGGYPEAMVVLARAYLANNEPDRAISTYSGLEEMLPENHIGPYMRGEVLLRQGKNREAREAFEIAAQRAPEDAATVTRLAILDLRENKGDAAVARVKAAIETMSEPAELLQVLGVIHAQCGQPAEAEQAFRAAIEASPTNMTSYIALTRLLAEQGRTDEALVELEEALANNPDDVRTLMLSAMFLEEKEDFAKALERYERVIELEPRLAQAYNNAAYIRAARMGEVDKGFELARRARELAPRDAAVADTLGWIAYLRGDYPWALALIQEGAEAYGDHPEVLHHLGMVQLAMGDEAQALQALSRAVELDEGRLPNPDPVRAVAAMLAVPIEDIRPEHQALIDAVLADDPENPAARVRLGALREQAGNPAAWNEARTTYQAVRQSHPNYLPATVQLIDLLDGPLDDPARALQLARDARTANPESPAIARRAGWLALRTGDIPWAHGLLQEAARAASDPEAQYRLAISTYCTGQPGEAMRLLQSALTTAAADAAFRAAAERFQTLLRAAAAADPSPDAQRIAEAVDDTDPLFIPAQMVVAHARERAGNPAEALDAYQSLLAKRPTFPLAAREAARLLVEAMNDPDKAYPLAVKAREALPQDPETARLLGRISYERKDYPYAARLLEQALRANPDDSESRYLLGLSRHHQGDTPGARQALEAALAAAPDSPLAPQAREALATME